MGASQLIGLGFHIMLLLLFAYITGSSAASSFTPSRTLVSVLLAVAVLTLVAVSIPACAGWSPRASGRCSPG